MEAIYKRLESKTVLIVEDDESTLKWLVRVLSLYFDKVYFSSDAISALEIFKQTPPDIVLADIQMPEVDGLSFLQKIKSIDENVFLIVMTAFNSSPYINRAVESGIHLYLKKPIDIDELLVAMSSHFSSQRNLEEKLNLGQGFIFDYARKIIKKEQNIIDLTKKELLLLELLIKNRQGFVSLETIEQTIWQENTSSDAIRMIIVGLRKKLHTSLIENLKGLGYRINLN